MAEYANFNEAGEPLIDAAALRFEQELDRQSAEERYLDDNEGFFYDYDDEPCEGCDNDPEDCTCEDDYEVPEDAAMEAGLFGWDC